MPRGTETVLLVEDDELVRNITHRILADHGYKVIVAADGEAGLRELETRAAEKLDMLLTDVIMPRLSGKELADRAAQLRPDLRILFISGYTDNALEEKGALAQGIELLQKPFTPTVLLSRIRAVLDAKR